MSKANGIIEGDCNPDKSSRSQRSAATRGSSENSGIPRILLEALKELGADVPDDPTLLRRLDSTGFIFCSLGAKPPTHS
jgi:hypothetical protein